MSDLKDKSEADLLDQARDSIIPSFVWGVVGLILIFGSVFWRAIVLPPRLVIDYGDAGGKLWSYGGEILRTAVPPDVPSYANFVMITCICIGVVAIVITNRRLYAAWNEVRRRDREGRGK